MFYFKFKDKCGDEMYGSITVDNIDKATPEQKQGFIEELKKLCFAETLKEVSKKEYDEQTENFCGRMTHHLKTLPEFFQAAIDGRKPMEFRKDDRNFKVGDYVILEEYEGFVDVPGCPDRDYCHKGWQRPNDEEEFWEQPEECKNKLCDPYRKELYTGRRCLVKIKEIFKLDAAGFPGYVAFTHEIKHITDMEKKANE